MRNGLLGSTDDVNSLNIEVINDGVDDVIEGLPALQQEVVRRSYQNMKDNCTWKHQDLIDDYLVATHSAAQLCTSAHPSFTDDDAGVGSSTQMLRFSKNPSFKSMQDPRSALFELKSIHETGTRLLKEYTGLLGMVKFKLITTSESSQAKKKIFHDMLENAVKWRKYSNVLSAIMFVSIVIASVVAAVVKLPPWVTPLIAALIVPLGPVWKWVNSNWRECETDMRKKRDIFKAMHTTSCTVSQELANIVVLMEKLYIQNEKLSLSVFDLLKEMEVRETNTVVIDKERIEKENLLGEYLLLGETWETCIHSEDLSAAFKILEGRENVFADLKEEIKRMVGDLVKSIHDLSEHASKCADETKSARKQMFPLIINHHIRDQEMAIFS